MAFTWIPFYKEFSQKLLKYRNNRTPLINWIYDNLEGYINHFKDGTDGRRVPDTDPFTVFALINRGITIDKKKDICAKFKGLMNISTPVPEDFTSVPEMNNQKSNFMAFEDKREEGDIERLWKVFEDAVFGRDIEQSYNALSNQYLISKNLTIGLFWIRPDKYLALDGNSCSLLKSFGIAKVKPGFVPFDEYRDIMKRLDAKMESGELECTSYPEFSQLAYWKKDGASKGVVPKSKEMRYWLYAPGPNASKWSDCKSEGIMCIGWGDLGNLTNYSSREDMQEAIKTYYSSDSSGKNDSLAVWQFTHEMKPGDIVFVKKGRSTIIGRGVVESDYEFDISRDDYKHLRKVKWTDEGEWLIGDTTAMKTLTDITRNPLLETIIQLFDGSTVSEPKDNYGSADVNYWWLVANPSIWSVTDFEVGEEQSYTFYNDEGNKRRIFKHFLSAKKGDIVIGYDSSPRKQILGLFVVSGVDEGKELYFKKTRDLPPVDLATLRSTPELSKMEYMRDNQGSFFKVTPDEFKVIMKLAYGESSTIPTEKKEKYSKEDFLKEVFVSKDDYNSLENLLLRKKNLILQGAPGVGKTFAAKRLAYAMMGEKDEERIKQVQFHQNYSYEDFVMGYKPNENGGFDLKNGIFYKFCKRAENDSERKYFVIIDEINRGNLSKIFGELLMLIENDYRNKPIQLAYKDEEFAVPENLYIIGMMNTADRSLAMIDYALRRRFSFFEMKPGFENPVFREEIEKQKDPQLNSLVKAIVELNKVIEADDSLGSGFCIGHSYLCNLGKHYDLANIVEYDIIPMLREYWFDNNERFNQEAQKLRNALK